MAETVKEEKKRHGRNPLLIFAGLALLGLALALLIFGNSLFSGQEAESGGQTAFLQQVPELNTTSGLPTLTSDEGFLSVGSLAHDFELQNLEGDTVSLAEFRGQPVIINFWATWCAPCRIEMPELQASFEKYKDDGLIILALDQDESPELVRSFFYDEFGLTFTPLLDVDQAVAMEYGVFNFPTSFFINGDGIITAIHRGPALQSQIDDYLADTIQ